MIVYTACGLLLNTGAIHSYYHLIIKLYTKYTTTTLKQQQQ